MGIDMYLHWRGMAKEEKEAQYTGFSIDKGNLGYLREAYHGGPYATKVLAPECWTEAQKDQDDDSEIPSGVQIPVATLKERLPRVIETAIQREKLVYNNEVTEDSDMVKAFVDFVELAEEKEKLKGEPCWVYSSY